VVWELDDLQHVTNEGPCVTSMREAQVVVVPEIRHEQRWPRFVPEAVMRTGLKAQMAVHLHVNDKVLGGLNLYSTSSATIEPGAAQTAELFATHAALALARARREDDLNNAITTRQEIGMAIGLTMARFSIDSERAFQYLVRASSTSQMKMRDIATEIINAANAPHQGQSEQLAARQQSSGDGQP
jgi:GAF domain-containing protein